MARVFEISSGNGLISIYALCKTRGEGGKADPKLEALLADRAQRLKEQQEMAKLAVPTAKEEVQSAQQAKPIEWDSSSILVRQWGVLNPAVKEETLPKQLLSLKAKTSWSWERMCREFHRVMAHEGPSHTTLDRYASGRVKRPNVVTEHYVREAIDKLTAELSRKQNRLR